jgi:BlaI family penicillinase repressor
MPQPPTISDAEWHVMQVLWQDAPRTAADVVEALAADHDWHPRTVKTMLGRLVGKGVLAFTRDGKRYLYRPAVTRDAAIREQVRSLRDRAFDGATGSMLAYLVRHNRLSRDDLNELKRLLDEEETA